MRREPFAGIGPGKGGSMGGFMHLPRSLAALSAALLLASTMPQLAQAREIVGFSDPYSSGTVVVKTSERALYYVLGNGKAMRYPVGVGRAGRAEAPAIPWVRPP